MNDDNKARADRAKAALISGRYVAEGEVEREPRETEIFGFEAECSVLELEAAITDGISDLLHLARETNLNPTSIFRTAVGHYGAECINQAEQNNDAPGDSSTKAVISAHEACSVLARACVPQELFPLALAYAGLIAVADVETWEVPEEWEEPEEQ